MRDPLHQAAVAAKHEGAVIDDRMFAAVERQRELLLGDCHPDRRGEALAQRAGGGLDAGGQAVFRMARRLRMELAEVFQFVERQVVAGQVQQAVQQHGAMAVGQYESVPVRPGRISGIVAQVVAPEDLGDVGHAHRHPGVAGLCLLHRIDSQEAQRVRQQPGGRRRLFRGDRVHDRLLRLTPDF